MVIDILAARIAFLNYPTLYLVFFLLFPKEISYFCNLPIAISFINCKKIEESHALPSKGGLRLEGTRVLFEELLKIRNVDIIIPNY